MVSKRRAAALVVGLGLAVTPLAACGGGGAGGGGGGSDVEVFTWWTSGGEKAGLDGLSDGFASRCADQTFVNAAIAGGTGSNSKQVLASRLQQGDPPDTFQVHAGAEVTDYINAGQVEDLTAKYTEWGLDSAFPQSLIDSMSVDGKVYSVPANIHRIVLWSNTDVLGEAGVATPVATIDELLSNLQALRDKGVQAPLAVGVDWTQTELLESVLLSELGGEAFTALWAQDADWSSPEVTSALEKYQALLAFSNDDRDSLDWTDAEKLLVGGQAAYQLMGDWEVAEFEADGFTAYAHQAFPGTEANFQWLADAFVLPTGAPNPEGADCWLETVGSAEGQQAFNVAKGSIPARIDADPSDYPEYQQAAMADFQSLAVVPSCANGSACTVAGTQAVNSAVGKFSTDGDIESLQSALGDAVGQYGTTAS